jgi:hypothetical protein
MKDVRRATRDAAEIESVRIIIFGAVEEEEEEVVVVLLLLVVVVARRRLSSKFSWQWLSADINNFFSRKSSIFTVPPLFSISAVNFLYDIIVISIR